MTGRLRLGAASRLLHGPARPVIVSVGLSFLFCKMDNKGTECTGLRRGRAECGSWLEQVPLGGRWGEGDDGQDHGAQGGPAGGCPRE